MFLSLPLTPRAQGPPPETFCPNTVYPSGWGILRNTIQFIFKFKEEFCLPPSLWSAQIPDLWPNPYPPGDWGPPSHKQLPFPLNPHAQVSPSSLPRHHVTMCLPCAPSNGTGSTGRAWTLTPFAFSPLLREGREAEPHCKRRGQRSLPAPTTTTTSAVGEAQQPRSFFVSLVAQVLPYLLFPCIMSLPTVEPQ